MFDWLTLVVALNDPSNFIMLNDINERWAQTPEGFQAEAPNNHSPEPLTDFCALHPNTQQWWAVSWNCPIDCLEGGEFLVGDCES